MTFHYRRRCFGFVFSIQVLLLCLSLSVSTGEGITCTSGWTKKLQEIPPERINDGYCDCPLDGADELGTGACSGSMDGGWAGIEAVEEPSPHGFFQCPQQPRLHLPLSHVHDDICDCCDGSDELPGKCPDICAQVLAEERAARARAEKSFAKGSAKRKSELETFNQFTKETAIKIDELEKQDIPALTAQLEEKDAKIRELKLKFVTERMTAVADMFSPAAIGKVGPLQRSLAELFESLTMDQLFTLIAYLCQISGELADANDNASHWKNGRTCIPLRLAGLDLGFVWEHENFRNSEADFHRIVLSDENEADLLKVANLMEQAYEETDRSIGVDDIIPEKKSRNKRKKSKNKKKRQKEEEEDSERRRMERDDDDYYPPVDDDMLPDDYEMERGFKPRESKDETVGTAREMIVQTVLSVPRISFKSKASAIVDKIDKLLEADMEYKEEKVEDESEEEDRNLPPDFDPMAAPMVKNSLSKRMEHVDRGLDYATSAAILLDALEVAGEEDLDQLRRDCTALAAGVMMYSEVSLDDISEIIYLVLGDDMKEIQAVASTESSSCTPATLITCPPVTVKVGEKLFPPQMFVSAAERLCERVGSLLSPDTCSDEESLPTAVADGHLGYRMVEGRYELDPLVDIFSVLEQYNLPVEELDPLEDEAEGFEARLESLQQEINDLKEEMGGDGSKYGDSGELYSLRDSCHEVEQGKYVYELCIFGSAQQKDAGSGKSARGTDLGRWDKMEINPETGERVLYWQNGAKCWNGPKRSATMHITCGDETKILHADEPETCTYVFQAQSHIACDDAAKAFYEL